MSEENEKLKTKDQSRFEYMEALQYEYLCAELRKKIYRRGKDKEFWQKVMDGKKDKIVNIGNRNGLPTIFSDSRIKNDTLDTIIRDRGMPNFKYDDIPNADEIIWKDYINYYARETEVKVHYGDDIKIGTIKYVNTPQERVKVHLKDEDHTEWVDIEDVTRIL